jgi:hypothetical protein
VRELRSETDATQPVSREEQHRRADALIAADPKRAEELVFGKIRDGTALNPAETLAADKLTAKGFIRALSTGKPEDLAATMRLRWRYYDSRAETARTLGVIRDAMPRSAAEALADAIEEPSAQTRARVRELRERLREASPAEAKAIQAQLDAIANTEAKKVEKIRQALAEAGLPVEQIGENQWRDPIVWGRIKRIVSTHKSGFWDKVLEWRISSLVSWLGTTMRNIYGNTINAAIDQHGRRVAEAAVNLIVRDPNSASFGESVASLRIWFPALQVASRNFLLAYRTEAPVFEADLLRRGIQVAKAGSKFDITHRGPAIKGALGRAVRAIGTTALMAQDEFGATLVAMTEAHALAYRQAKAEGAKDLYARQKEILANPDGKVWDKAIAKADHVLFREQLGPVGQKVMGLRGAIDQAAHAPIASFEFPFLKTPLNVFKQGISNANPLASLVPLYRGIMGKYADAKPQLVRDLAHSAIATGVFGGLMALILDEDEQGLPRITGSPDAAQRRAQGWTGLFPPPYSVRVAGHWYSYRQVEPVATMIASVVDVAQAWKTHSSKGAGEASAAAGKAMLETIVAQAKDKTFLQGFAELMDAMDSLHEDKSTVLPKMGRNFVASFVPNLVRQGLRVADERERQNLLRSDEDTGIWTAAAATLPWYLWPAAANAPPVKVDYWGRPIERQSGVSLLSPLPEAPTPDHALELDRLLYLYNRRFERGEILDEKASKWYPKPPSYRYQSKGVRHTWGPEEYERFSREAGELTLKRVLAQRSKLRFDEPGWADIQLISEAATKARDEVKARMLRSRTQEARR